jgi:adenylate cyclase
VDQIRTEPHPDAVVDALVARGVPREKAQRAHAEGRVPIVLLEHLLDEPRPYTIRQVANAAGIPLADLRAIYEALGVGEDELHGDPDVEEARLLRDALRHLPLDAVTRMARARRLAASQLAVADMVTLRDVLLVPMREAEDDDAAVAGNLADSAAVLWPALSAMSVNAYRRGVLGLLDQEVVAAAIREPTAGIELAVGFVDVVGYTQFAAQVAPDGLGEVLEAFERHVLHLVGSESDVTVTKFIGDAAMLVGTDPVHLAEVLISITSPTEWLSETPLRAGLAAGQVVVRGGDYFGTPVNVAARLTDYARPNTVLADPELRDLFEGRFEVRRIKKLKLHGVGSVRPIAVHHPRPGGE